MYWQKRPPKEFNPKKRLGLIHVYTGEGKGKSSAALGIALRAAGHKLRVVIIHFIKGHKDYGEMLVMDRLHPHLEVVQFGTPEPTNLAEPSAMDTYLAEQGFEYARRLMNTNRPDVLILDEINTALHYKLIPMKPVLDFLDNKHQQTEVILTGRQAPKELLNAADIVTVMTSTKHPYDDDSFQPRKGIEH